MRRSLLETNLRSLRVRLTGAALALAISVAWGAMVHAQSPAPGLDLLAWRSNFSTLSSVEFRGVLPGIDLVLRGQPDAFEALIAVDSRASTDPLQLTLATADGLTLAGGVAAGSVDGTPVSLAANFYQVRDGALVAVPGGLIVSGTRLAVWSDRSGADAPLIISVRATFANAAPMTSAAPAFGAPQLTATLQNDINNNGVVNPGDTLRYRLSMSNIGDAPITNVVTNLPLDPRTAPVAGSLNVSPIGLDQAITTNEDIAAPITLTGSDADGHALTFTIVTPPAHGSAMQTSAGGAAATYMPPANYSGPDSFTVRVNDGRVSSNEVATIAITVAAVNDAPSFTKGANQSVPENSPAQTVAGWATDMSPGPADESAQTVSFEMTNNTAPLLFSVAPAIANNGTLTYTPAPTFFGTATISVRARDNGGTANGGADASAVSTFTIEVQGVNDAPSFTKGADQTVLEDAGPQTVAGWATALSSGTGDPTQTLSFEITNNTNTALFSAGPAVSGTNGDLTYTPAANANGTATITLRITDDGGTANGGVNVSPTQTFVVNVTAVNDTPVADNDAYGVNEGGTINEPAAGVLIGDTDVEGSVLTAVLVTGPVNAASFTLNANGSFTYTHNGSETLADSFTYRANDGTANSAPATVTITITPINDAPMVLNESFQLLGNTELRVDLPAGTPPHTVETTTNGATPWGGLLDNDTDADSTLVITAIGNGCGDASPPFDCTLADGAVVHVEAGGAFSYVPPPGAVSGSLSYTVGDGIASVGGTATFNVAEMVWYVNNNAPPGGNGTSSAPLNALTTLNGTGPGVGSDLDDADDYIFVSYGNGTANGQGLGLELEAGQHLIGEFQGLSIPVSLNGNGSPTVVVAQPSATACGGDPCRPLITNVADNAVTVTAAMAAEITGFRLGGGTVSNAIDVTTSTALSGSPTLTIQHNVFEGAGAEGLDVDLNPGTTGMLNLAVRNNRWNPAGTHAGFGVEIQRLAGTLNLAFDGNTDIVGPIGVHIFSNSAADATITGFAGNSISGDAQSYGLAITGVTFDAVPGGTVQPVDGNTLIVGSSGNPVSDRGIAFQSVQGGLFFDDLDVFADNAGLSVFGLPGLSLAVEPAAPDGTGTSSITAFSALFLENVAIDLRLQNLSCPFGGTCVSLHDVAGVLRAAPGSTMTKVGGTMGPDDAAFYLDNSGAGTTALTVLYEGPITNLSGTGHAVIVNNADSGSAISFTRQVTDATGFGSGVSLTSNTGATIDFTGGLTLSTGANDAFTATGGGTVTVVDPPGAPNNTIATTTGRALNVSNTTIGAADLTFERISSGEAAGAGPVNGINLDTTGILGGLIVTGNGGPCDTVTPTCSGGTIQSSTGDAIRLVSTRDVSLTRMRIHDNDTNGIYGDELTNFTLSNSVVTDNDVANPGALEAGIKFNELYGTASIANTVVRGTRGDNIRLEMGSGTLNNFTISNATVGPTADLGGGVYGNGLSIITSGSGPTITATVTNSLFTGVDNLKQQASGILTAIGAGTTTLSVIGSDFDQEHIGINLSSSGTGTHRFHVNDNDLTLHRNNAINIQGTSIVDGTVTNNRIGIAAADSGSQDAAGIAAMHSGNATWRLALNNNTVRHSDTEGILVRSGDSGAGDTGSVHVTASGNTIDPPDDDTGPSIDPNGMWFRSRQSTTLCANIANNASQGKGTGTGYRVERSDTSLLQLQGFATDAQSTLAANGNTTAGGAPTVTSIGGGMAPCTATLPSFP